MDLYEQKYKDALERAKHALDCDRNNLVSTDTSLIYSMFPELKESEDERTRKDIIQFVQSRLAGFPECERFVTWLEKQKEPKDNENHE